MVTKEEITDQFKEIQDEICRFLESEDGKERFREDHWERPEGGGGRSRSIANGDLIEKGGVNFSAVFGETPEKIRKAFGYEATNFYATGISIVLHPQNPHVPIIHMNVRYFEMDNGTWWFGGGIDLTPHFINKEDAAAFHRGLREVCNRHDPAYYGRFKEWADDYFYLPHRSETRGVGGIFFDRLHAEDKKETIFEFVTDVARSFIPLYDHQVQKNRNKSFSEAQRTWQLMRRGRYVEFNLIHDRGTKFGLETNGRIESIFMSLPPLASWTYDYKPEQDSPEAETLSLLKKNIDWIDEGT